MDLNFDNPENEFLSILALKPKIGIPLLQIKPAYLLNEDNRRIYESMLKSIQKFNTVDLMYVMDDTKINQTKLEDIVSNTYLPITNTRFRFLTCQSMILDAFKERIISLYEGKRKKREIKIEDYLSKIDKLQQLNIKLEDEDLSYEEIMNGLKESRISFAEYAKLSTILKLNEDDLFIIGARTGTGKSALMLNLMDDLLNQKKEYKCIYFNLEMSKADMYSRMISIRSGVQLKCFENNFKYAGSDDMKKINEGISEILELKKKMTIISKPQSLDDIEQNIKFYKSDKVHTIVFIDHMGLIETNSNLSLYEETTKVSKRLRQLCLKYNVTIISASQVRRGTSEEEDISISDLKNSGEIENSACKIVLISRSKSSPKDSLIPEMHLDIVKNRSGFLGNIPFIYDKTRQIFSEKKG